jgi:alkanesulfonate monooxygenase SsuD/methylene tetrahydromethanopterin reductase-like flavin-dependent oxidoreductase (luciferase family)
MNTRNKLKLGLFGSNCSSGMAATKVPERWENTWADNLRLAQLADEAGFEFMLPIGRWKGYGGETNFEGATFETITWATGLLGATKRLSVFGTVHAPLISPVFAAKQMVTADHVGSGRFGLNIVCGWNQDEFAMFGAKTFDDEQRYKHGGEWLSLILQMWERDTEFDFSGEFFDLRGVRADPKPYGGSRPLIMNAALSPIGKAFAYRNCDAVFTILRNHELGSQAVAEVRAGAAALGRAVGVYTSGHVVCRPTQREAEEYYRNFADENADWDAVSNMFAAGMNASTRLSPEEARRMRMRLAAGYGNFPVVGDPDHVAAELAQISADGYDGLAFSFVNYLDELPFFQQEVLPRLVRLGLRAEMATEAYTS